MKTLVFYNKETGQINFTQEVIKDVFDYLIEDIPVDKVAISVDVENKSCNLDDTQEIKDERENLRKTLDELNQDADSQKLALLNKQEQMVEIMYKLLGEL